MHSILTNCLKTPAIAHHTMTSECTPLLSGALPAYETFMEQWKCLSTFTMNLQFGLILSEGVVYAEQYQQLMHGNSTYVVAMCKQNLSDFQTPAELTQY